jgi:hypothetical protein
VSALLRHSVWFGRIVLGASILLLVRIGSVYVSDPIGASSAHAITLGSPEAVTIMRVTGSVFIAIAIALGICLAAKRLAAGLGLLAIVATTILAVRLVGIGLDGPAPFTMRVLRPEVALVILTTLALFLERKRATVATSLIEGEGRS